MSQSAPDGQAAGTSNPAIVTMAGLRFAWNGPNAFSLTIRDFALPAKSRMLVIGPSGSGKSTFLSLIAGIVTPDDGRLDVLGTNMSTLSSSARDRFRAEHFGIIFQMFNLLPYGSVVDNVVLPLSFASKRRARAEGMGNVEAEASRLLSSLGLDGADFGSAPASRLSVGQQQRVAAARALIGRPEIIIADEPTSALDRDRQIAFLDLLFSEIEAAGAALIMVSHDETLASRFDSVIRLDEIAVSERAFAP